jgi:hypothetical protein
MLVFVHEKARECAIVKELDEPVSLKDGTVVLQFETRLQEGLECGGAYLKYLRPQEAGWKPNEFDNESPYTIMFGPDKCGATNKVHFISYLSTYVYSGNSELHLLKIKSIILLHFNYENDELDTHQTKSCSFVKKLGSTLSIYSSICLAYRYYIIT